ncbi:hypothetical protein NDU88_001512 [Pleurodeles waltl]|uniref:Uncharacterized protein n=1 Tax=Pleurodeles waltl TaxID=8319 RepID=A0AAV7V9Y0_PLEWA|nr:hypothetical protein NDU88_001512 [Pleurodeles waltl]
MGHGPPERDGRPWAWGARPGGGGPVAWMEESAQSGAARAAAALCCFGGGWWGDLGAPWERVERDLSGTLAGGAGGKSRRSADRDGGVMEPLAGPRRPCGVC